MRRLEPFLHLSVESKVSTMTATAALTKQFQGISWNLSGKNLNNILEGVSTQLSLIFILKVCNSEWLKTHFKDVFEIVTKTPLPH